MKHTILLVLIFCLCKVSLWSQGAEKNIPFEVNRVFPSFYLSLEELDQAITLQDLNQHYESDWVDQYINVKIITRHNGVALTTIAKNDTLTSEQMARLTTIDPNSEVKVLVDYLPKNSFKNKEAKVNKFSFRIDPQKQAQYKGGNSALNTYLETNLIKNLSYDVFDYLVLGAVTFTIDPDGQIIDVVLTESTKDQVADAALVEAICNMPDWDPARFGTGETVAQKFALTVGDMSSCVVNLLMIDRLPDGAEQNHR